MTWLGFVKLMAVLLVETLFFTLTEPTDCSCATHSVLLLCPLILCLMVLFQVKEVSEAATRRDATISFAFVKTGILMKLKLKL